MAIAVRDVEPDEHEAFLDCHLAGQAYSYDDERRAQVLRDLAQPGLRRIGAYEDGALIGVGLDFVTDLTMPGGTQIPVGALTWVAVLPTHRRRGAMRALIAAHHDGYRERGLAAGTLLAARSSLYARYGYGPAVWQASLSIDTRYGEFHEPPPAGSLALVTAAEIAREGPAIWRAMQVRPGAMGRAPEDWSWLAAFPGERYFCLYRDEGGTPRGYASYSVDERWTTPDPAGRVEVTELIAADGGAEAALWRYLLDLDHITEVRAPHRPTDDPLRHRLIEPRRLRTSEIHDHLWLAPFDPARLLTARSAGAPGRFVLGIDDLRLAVEADADGAIACAATAAEPDLSVDPSGLATVLLGATSVTTLAAAGRAHVRDAAVLRTADALFAWSPQPWCPLEF